MLQPSRGRSSKVQLDPETSRSHGNRSPTPTHIPSIPSLRRSNIILLKLLGLDIGIMASIPPLARLVRFLSRLEIRVVPVLRADVGHGVMTNLATLFAFDASFGRGFGLARLGLLKLVHVFGEAAKVDGQSRSILGGEHGVPKRPLVPTS